MIKYECENCGQLVGTSEALGPGVFTDISGNMVQGKAYVFVDRDAVVNVTVQLDRDGSENQFCYACMWKSVRKMIDEMSPDVMKVTEWNFIIPGIEDAEVIVEVPNEGPTDSSATDTELHELHIEGYLPESGPTEYPGNFPHVGDNPRD